MSLTNNSGFKQAEGLSEGSRGLERQWKPPVRTQNKYDPERFAETRVGRFWHPFRVPGILKPSPGVSLRSTPGYRLATLRVGKITAV